MKNFFLPFRGVFCRVEPVAFDGTLSFLELLAKLQDYVNKLNANLNEIETALEEFEQYVETALDGKQDVLTFDTVPTDGSTNPVESNGIYDALAGKQDVLTFDTIPTDGSTNPVESNGIYDALAGKQDVLTFDTVPTDGSQNPVTSDGIYDALAGKQNVLTFDTTPTDGSQNPVTSDGIYDALAGKVDTSTVTDDIIEDSTAPITSGAIYGLQQQINTALPVYINVTLDAVSGVVTPDSPNAFTEAMAYANANRETILRVSFTDAFRNDLLFMHLAQRSGSLSLTYFNHFGTITATASSWTFTAS